MVYSESSDIVDSLRYKGHSKIDLSIEDTGRAPQNCFLYSSNTFEHTERGQTSIAIKDN